jgi:hypothetical protein
VASTSARAAAATKVYFILGSCHHGAQALLAHCAWLLRELLEWTLAHRTLAGHTSELLPLPELTHAHRRLLLHLRRPHGLLTHLLPTTQLLRQHLRVHWI